MLLLTGGVSLHLCPVGNGLCAIPILRRSVKHIFNKDSIPHCWIIDQNMGDGADELAVLDNGTAAHADVK